VADLAEECAETGRVPDAAFKLIDAYESEERVLLYRQLFGREPTP
jgi:hypothetical protein